MVIEATQRTLIKFRAMGIATNRLHSDRAKELLSRQMRKWCATMGILQTFTAGDDPASNGHIESEVNQLERKTRVKLALGVPMLPMIPFYAMVYVKMKKWHKEGGLAAPFVRGRLRCPCPLMSDGWVVELTDGKILHVREAVQPNMEALHFSWRRNHSLEGQRTGWWANNLLPVNNKYQVHHGLRILQRGGDSSPLSTSRKATSGGDAAASLDPQPVDKEDIYGKTNR